MQGRFTGVDPKMLGVKQIVNPQRWNRYEYVVNNPLALYDPDGAASVYLDERGLKTD
jgi:RHS repeat-associated protein